MKSLSFFSGKNIAKAPDDSNPLAPLCLNTADNFRLDNRMLRRVKIVATLVPATEAEEVLDKRIGLPLALMWCIVWRFTVVYIACLFYFAVIIWKWQPVLLRN